MKILVTGGCGYIGSVLVPKLLAKEHEVVVFDTCWFGNFLAPHPRLRVYEEDFRNITWLGGYDAVIHLAAIANDPTGDLKPDLTWDVNAAGSTRLAQIASQSLVKQFLYASSGSVYGICDWPKVTEDAPLVPLSEYNRTKAAAEKELLALDDGMAVQILRPATVCGWSPRLRLDVVVNALTALALRDGRIELQAPEAVRPNIHIEDMTDLYLWMLARPQLTGVWNAGFENFTVRRIAQLVAERIPAELTEKPTNDPRSYRMDSSKLLAAGFKPKHKVVDAIDELIAHHAAGTLRDEERCYNLKTMRARGL